MKTALEQFGLAFARQQAIAFAQFLDRHTRDFGTAQRYWYGGKRDHLQTVEEMYQHFFNEQLERADAEEAGRDAQPPY